ncbi:MAG: RagB/SusD domain protein [Sphingobacteriales bacterium]|nr:RagB/SusD domain protein [Sphingobacteriales bacterium]
MTRLKFKYIGMVLIAAVSFASCKKDFLERPPEDSIVDANYYKTADQVLAGTAPLYGIVWFSYNDKASHGIGDGRGGILTSGSYQVDNIRMNTTAITGENASSWKSFYNVVGQANTAIGNINKYASAEVPASVKQQAIAEARFMRGVAYSYLVQNWGPIPVITDNSTLLQDTTISRNTEESVWEFIIRDIRFAAENLPVTAIKGRLNKYSAEGMLSRMYLARSGVGSSGGTRRQTDLDSAKYFAQDVIEKSGAILMPNYEDLFMTKNNNNAESLFSLQWTYNGDWGSQNSTQAFLAFGSAITGFADGWGGDLGASADQLKLYDPNYVSGNVINITSSGDKRRKATFMFPGDHYSYIHQQVDDVNNPGKTLIQELDVPWNNNTAGRYNNRAWVKKYVVGRPQDNDGKVTQQHTENCTYMQRLSDVYLIYAEAILGNNASTSDVEALKYFNLIRARAGVPAKASLTWDDIYKERRLEFAMEGMAWYDLIRLYYFNPTKAFAILNSQDRSTSYRIVPNAEKNAVSWTVTSMTPEVYPVSASNFRLPIPSVELTKAPNLGKPPVPYTFGK